MWIYWYRGPFTFHKAAGICSPAISWCSIRWIWHESVYLIICERYAVADFGNLIAYWMFRCDIFALQMLALMWTLKENIQACQ